MDLRMVHWRTLPDRRAAGIRTAFGGSFRRIVQTPGGIAIFYDVGQGQGWQRNIVMDGSPHLPAGIRQWYGDSRGRFEGDTLVIDVTNFSPKTDYQGSRENLLLIERWKRTGPEHAGIYRHGRRPERVDEAWTVVQEFHKQNDTENRIYYEPRCNEGTMVCRDCCMRDASKSAPLRRDEVLTPRNTGQHDGGFCAR